MEKLISAYLILCFVVITPLSLIVVAERNVEPIAYPSFQEFNLSDSFWNYSPRTNNSTLESSFADDRISVVMTRRTSMQMRIWGVNDFPELNLISVQRVSEEIEKYVKQQVNYARAKDTSLEFGGEKNNGINIGAFRQSLILVLAISCKQNV